MKLPDLQLKINKQRRIVAYLDGLQAQANALPVLAYLNRIQAQLVSLRQLQSATEDELSALLPSVLDRAFKVEL